MSKPTFSLILLPTICTNVHTQSLIRRKNMKYCSADVLEIAPQQFNRYVGVYYLLNLHEVSTKIYESNTAARRDRRHTF